MIGQTISHYRITGKLGEGGMGVVFRATDTELDREVALKLLPAEMAENPKRLERFRREAKAVAALNHPNIVTIHSIESADATHFLTMELVDGESLDHGLPPGGLPLTKVFEIAIPLADALAAAHDRGIIHRDLKPANVMVSREGRVKVLDFGLVKLIEDPTSSDGEPQLTAIPTQGTALTGIGVVMGTAPYMSPEQVEGRQVDHRTDIFALGVVLYEMATGRRPFGGESSAALVSSILRDTPPTVTAINESLPRHLARIIEHCLEKDPEARYQSAKDVRNELTSLRRELESGVVETGSGPLAAARAAGRRRAMPWRWLAAGAAAVAILAAGWWIGRGAVTGEPAPDASRPAAAAAPAAAGVPSVAVLPFANLSPDPDNEYFTDGLTEELISALANVDGLRIPARSSVYALKGSELGVREIGAKLGVDNVIEGSVRRSGDRLRVSVQLIKVDDGFNLWSETYDRKLEDVFAVQDEIAGSIVDALQLSLSPVEERALRVERTTDFQAYEYYLRGRGYYRRRTFDDFGSAREMFGRAIAIDPGYALAYAGLADTYTEFWRNYESTEENLAQAEEASRRAVELDPNLAEAHAARGFALGQRRLYEDAAREFRLAMQLNPRLFEAYYYYGTVAFAAGELETAAEMFERATAVAPDEIRALQLLPQVYTRLGRATEAQSSNRRRVEVVERRLEFNPDDVPLLLDGASALAALGETRRSLEWASRILDRAGNDALVLYNLACLYSLAGEVSSAMDALERSYDAGLADPEWMEQDSDLDNVREHPRYRALVKRMHGDH
ncbi:MAG: protein kinase [Thermoanaerobaculales bacterium]|jgi:non-specific serine/threonine protein kinase|nr:protein kinase [Thermoanaerobaculales bacterium]